MARNATNLWNFREWKEVGLNRPPGKGEFLFRLGKRLKLKF